MNSSQPETTHRVFISLGSNLGDRMAYLQTAVNGLPGVVTISPLYETEPVGGPDDQPEFLNCVVELRTSLGPIELLTLTQQLENEAQRVRTIENGPRTLDIDILLYDGAVINEPALQIPHPRMWERRFVVQPLNDIAPDLVPESAVNKSIGKVRRVTTNLSPSRR